MSTNSEKYYVSGCVEIAGTCSQVADDAADFFTLYERDDKGLSQAIVDLGTRKNAEAVMAVYMERDRLLDHQQKLESFKTAYLEWSDKMMWVQQNTRRFKFQPFGMHIADVLKIHVDMLEEQVKALNSSVIQDVIAERQRQQSVEGWTPEHDDEHKWGEMSGAAGCYARHVNARSWIYPTDSENYQDEDCPDNWPWDASYWKPKSPRQDLVRAAALIVAEIERIDRAKPAEAGDE